MITANTHPPHPLIVTVHVAHVLEHRLHQAPALHVGAELDRDEVAAPHRPADTVHLGRDIQLEGHHTQSFIVVLMKQFMKCHLQLFQNPINKTFDISAAETSVPGTGGTHPGEAGEALLQRHQPGHHLLVALVAAHADAVHLAASPRRPLRDGPRDERDEREECGEGGHVAPASAGSRLSSSCHAPGSHITHHTAEDNTATGQFPPGYQILV